MIKIEVTKENVQCILDQEGMKTGLSQDGFDALYDYLEENYINVDLELFTEWDEYPTLEEACLSWGFDELDNPDDNPDKLDPYTWMCDNVEFIETRTSILVPKRR